MGDMSVFLSTPSARRATRQMPPMYKSLPYFYPRPPRGGRLESRSGRQGHRLFLSTPSTRRATSHASFQCQPVGISIHALREEGDLSEESDPLSVKVFLSTPSARRATRVRAQGLRRAVISIHALREEGDGLPPGRSSSMNFYPRPPRGGRLMGLLIHPRCLKFLSTPSARRATVGHDQGHPAHHISIHALREEGDDPAHHRTRQAV